MARIVLARMWRYPLIGAVLAMLLGACGFKLRAPAPLPRELSTLQLVIPDPGGDLAQELRTELGVAGARLVDTPVGAHATLLIHGERFDRRVLSVGRDGKAREYELRYELTYSLAPAGSQETTPPQSVVLLRDYSFDESDVLGKEAEESLLWKEMRRDAARQLVRRLSAARGS